MKNKSLFLLFVLFSVSLFSAKNFAQNSKGDASQWQDKNTYSIAIQAYIYGYPYIYLPLIRYAWTNLARDTTAVPYAPINSFWHASKLADATYKDGGSPNNDTYYSLAILDLRKEPVILEHPDMGNRYFTFELGDMSSDNWDYVGLRTTGSKAGKFLLYYKGWKGKIPPGVKVTKSCPTPWALVFGRTLVNGENDSKAAQNLIHQYKLVPYSNYISKKPFIAKDRKSAWPPFNSKEDSLADWKTMMKAMAENPPPEKDKPLLDLFASIGLKPGSNLDALSERDKTILVKASKTGIKILKGAVEEGYGSGHGNYWNAPSVHMGRAGQYNEFLFRGAVQCLGGIISNDTKEAVYFNTRYDKNGNELNGDKNNYRLHFSKDQLPKVDGFWSLTMYGMDHNLVVNPISRYSIGDRTTGIKKDSDGGITIFIQKDDPGKEKAPNWLPSSDGDFTLILRCYIPHKEIYEQKWYPPGIEKTN